MDPQDDDKPLSDLLRMHATRHVASPTLQASVRAEVALLAAADGRGAAAPRHRWWPWRRRSGWLAGMSFAAGAFAAAVLVLAVGLVDPFAGRAGLDDELIAGHVRSLMAGHLADVASTDQHTVKPWFQGKLDYSPPVEDFTAEGFPLVGGRLDYMGRRPVAALVYRRNSHIVNLYVWPSGEPASAAERLDTQQGYHLLRWRQAGMQYALVSDLNPRELQGLGRLWRERTAVAHAPQ